MRLITAFVVFCACCLLASCPVDPARIKLQSGRIESGIPTAPSSMAFIASFGGSGVEEGKFTRIGGLAAANGRVYVADQALSRIQYFDYFGEYLGSWGCGLNVNDFGVSEQTLAAKREAGETELMSPGVVQAIADRMFFRAFDIATYEGDVLVLNNFHSRADSDSAMMTPEIIRFSPEGELKQTYDIFSVLPCFIAVDEGNRRVGVSDIVNNAFEVFDLDTLELLGGSRRTYGQNYIKYLEHVYSTPDPKEQARLSRDWLRAGSAEGQFDFISGLAFYSAQVEGGETVDMVLTVDRNNNRIQVFTVDGTHLKTIKGRISGKNDMFTKPSDIAVSSKGLVYLTDQNQEQPRVIVFSSRFNPLYTLGHPQMKAPSYIELTDDGFVFVTDSQTNLVFVFGPKEEKLAAGKSLMESEPKQPSEAGPGS